MRCWSKCGSKKQMLSAIVPDSNWSSCITAPTCSRSTRGPMVESGTPSISTSPLVGSSRPSMILISVVLPPPEGPMMGHELPGRDGQVDVFQHVGLALGVAEADIAQLDLAVDAPEVVQRPVMPRFQRSEGDIGQALEMQAEDAQF